MRGPAIPKWLNDEARKEWRRIVPRIGDRLTRADYGVVESYCTAVGQVRELQVILNREGLTITGENGVLRPHPAVRMQGQAMTAVKALAAELGLSPKSRRHSTDAIEAPATGWEGLAS
ncbi:MAG: phage terminase small subunit P27 family [Rhodospirillaceae bacterium]